jgi:hypothetical protein
VEDKRKAVGTYVEKLINWTNRMAFVEHKLYDEINGWNVGRNRRGKDKQLCNNNSTYKLIVID